MQSVRIDPADHEILKDLAKSTDRPMADLMRDAIQDLNRKFILEATNNAYRALRQDTKAWADFQSENDSWDTATLSDANLEHWK
ncbi:MAG: toxin-antitoxin system protein [Planctomycetes bacterium]|nr:toxin-antitoxin system protein [Planctomycetota bacterium]